MGKACWIKLSWFRFYPNPLCV